MWLKNPEKLTDAQRAKLDKLKECDLDTAKAYRMRLIWQENWKKSSDHKAPSNFIPLYPQHNELVF